MRKSQKKDEKSPVISNQSILKELVGLKGFKWNQETSRTDSIGLQSDKIRIQELQGLEEFYRWKGKVLQSFKNFDC